MLSKLHLINIKETQTFLKDNPVVTGVSPRWIIPAKVENTKKNIETSTFLMLGDSKREI